MKDSDAMTDTRPNLLLIVCDQLRADHTGFGGSPYIETPNLDRLAQRGRTFDRAYVANPICMPNRASMLTGRAPSAHGVVANDSSLAWSTNTVARALRHAGYRTALVGKADLQNGLRRAFEPQREGPTALGDPYPTGWDRCEDPERFLTESSSDPPDFYGFERVALTIGHGDMVGGHHLRWALARGADAERLRSWGPKHALRTSDDWWQIYQPWLPEELYSSTFVAESTIEMIDDFEGGRDPWFVECSFPDPHHPFTPPGDWFDRHAPADVPLPATFADDLSSAPAHYAAFRGLKASRMMVQMFGPSVGQLRAAAAAEAGAIELIDDRVGRILDAVERCGRDTIVIFTSDHGDMFGDHGLMLKGMMHYEGCLRIPLVVAGVGAPARTRSLASSLDLTPTLLELAGVGGYEGIQGRSLVPTLNDPAEAVRDFVYVEEDFPQAPLFPFPVPGRARTLVTANARLTRYAGTEPGSHYDLAADPEERRNLWADPSRSAARRELSDRLLDCVMNHATPPALGPLAS